MNKIQSEDANTFIHFKILCICGNEIVLDNDTINRLMATDPQDYCMCRVSCDNESCFNNKSVYNISFRIKQMIMDVNSNMDVSLEDLEARFNKIKTDVDNARNAYINKTSN